MPLSAERPWPVGHDSVAIEAWIGRNLAGLAPPLKWTRLEGGHSKLSCLIEGTQARQAVIRRPPMGEMLPKAHDMAREWVRISARFAFERAPEACRAMAARRVAGKIVLQMR